jgi:hypothetical protein
MGHFENGLAEAGMVSGGPSAKAAGGTVSVVIYLAGARNEVLCSALI